jgi:hypothetical protein
LVRRFKVKRLLYDPISIVKQSFLGKPSHSPLPVALKIVFESDRAALKPHEPDNPNTFVLSPLLRHKNIRTTVRYTHVGYEQTRQTAEALSQALE